MKILHVISSLAPRYGGPSRACLELCVQLAKRDERVAIYTTDIDGGERLDVALGEPRWNDGVEIRYFPARVFGGYVFSLPLARALRVAIPHYDVVHIHSLYQFASTMAAHYCRSFRVPYIIRPHGTLDPYLYRRHRGRKMIYECLLERRNLDNAAAIHFTTLEEQELTRSLRLKAPGVVVPIGVDLREYAGGLPGAFREAWSETRGRKIVLFLGRLNFKKGLDLLARAFGRIGCDRDDVQLVLAGPDNEGYAARVRRWLEEEGVAAQSTFTGMLLGSKKLSALWDADVFVLPSYTENFGIAVVEAMACGLPVVISNRVNIWRDIADAKAGFVVNCNAEELSKALLILLDKPALGKDMGQRGRRLVKQRFTWEVVCEQMIQAYRQILSTRGYCETQRVL